jgi:hypothetical protein
MAEPRVKSEPPRKMRNRCNRMLWLAVLAVALICGSLAGSGEAHWLVIGNNAYDGLERLKNPVSDAKFSSLEYARVGWIFAGIRFVISRSPVPLRRVVPIFQPLTILSVKNQHTPSALS